MKKLLAMLLALMMVLSLAACGGSTQSEQPAETPAETESQDAETTEPEAEHEAEAEVPEESQEEAPAAEETEIQVFIAASLSNAFEELVQMYGERYPNVKITLNADSSGTLLSQIEEGYECDIFFSAAAKQINQLEEDDLEVEGTRVDLLRNEVVLITWKGSGTAVTGLENLAEAASMALADGSVPAGNYTRKALQAMGVLDSETTSSDITTEAVSEALGGLEINECSNVSKVLQAVAEGSNEVGTVYYSDAYSDIDRVDILEHISSELTGDIIYPVAQVVNPEADEVQTAAAADFLAFLQTDEAMEVFETYMFLDNR
ncbi:MAG: molybdate ABC transporter substrate-binding protein [Candidatus Onthomonas sp.]